MRKQKVFLCLMTAVLLGLAIALWVSVKQDEPISFQVISGKNVQVISLWKQEEGCYYAFLPSYAHMENVQISLHSDNPVTINGTELRNGMSCKIFAEGIAYPFSYTVWGKTWHEEIIFLRSANVAAMYIDTQSGNMDYIHREKGNKESGKLTLCLPDGTMAYSGDIVSIQGRGNATWGAFEKKPYSIRLAEAADLLDLGSAERWILLANANDRSQLRNKVIYDFADRLGLQFSPESEWVDLYLNGDYVGLYLLSERNEVHPERVNIAHKRSFLVSMEIHGRLADQNYPYVSTAAEQYLRVHYPEDPSSDQLEVLQNTWQSVENAILAENDIDPVTGKSWMELIDLDSWVKKYLIEEIFGNYDGCFISQFFYRAEDNGSEKIYAGPVWDYDNTMGSDAHWQLVDPNTLHANRYELQDGVCTPWFHALYQKELFYERIREIYQNEALPLLNGFLPAYISACSKQIADAYRMNQLRWNLGKAEMNEQTANLQDFMEKRIAFFDALWIKQLPHYIVRVDDASEGHFGYYVAFQGQTLRDLGVAETLGTEVWYDHDTGESLDLSTPVTENMMICGEKHTLSLTSTVRQMAVVILLLAFVQLLRIDLCRRKQ